MSWPRPSLGGEILVSAVVRDLVAGGSDVAFLERSDVELKDRGKTPTLRCGSRFIAHRQLIANSGDTP